MGGFILCFVIQANILYISPHTRKTARAQTKKPWQRAATIDLGSNERILGSEHKCRLDQAAQLLEG
jgi:hypothetical protein